MPAHDYDGRLVGLRHLMVEEGVGAVLLSIGADLPYYTGYEAMETERLTMLVVTPDEKPILVVPRLEAPRVANGPMTVRPWDETDDPAQIVGGLLMKGGVIAVGDRTRSVDLLRLQAVLPERRWLAASALTRRQRVVKDDTEAALLKSAADAVDRVLARIPAEVRFEGRCEHDVSLDLQRMTVEEGHEFSAFSIVASGPNGASPHHEPGERTIERGDLVVCDFGGSYEGYFSDVTRTFSIGPAAQRQVEIHAVVLAANEAGREAVAAGVSCREVDQAARSVINAAGYGEFFIHRTGHGIGLEVHEHPYLVEGNDERLQPGMAFSIEPGIYVPGDMGVRIEDIVMCGAAGAVELNQANRDLVEVT